MKKLGTVETNILAAKQPSTPQQNSGHTGPVNAVAFCEHTGSLLSCGSDGLLIQWDPTTGEIIKCHFACILCLQYCIRKYVADSDPVNSVAPFPDEQAIATGGVTIKLWDTVSGRCQKKFTGHPSPATQLVASKAQHMYILSIEYLDCLPHCIVKCCRQVHVRMGLRPHVALADSFAVYVIRNKLCSFYKVSLLIFHLLELG